MWDMMNRMVRMFIPGVGHTTVPKENATTTTNQGIKITTGDGYKSVSQIRAECRGSKTSREPVFILSSSKIWRRRVARILYGKEDEDYFL